MTTPATPLAARRQTSALEYDESDEFLHGGNRGFRAKTKMVSMSVFIVMVLALIGGAVVYVVVINRPAGTTTFGPATTTAGPDTPDAQGGPYCQQTDGHDCITCDYGFSLFGSPKRCFYKCTSNLDMEVARSAGKGLALDDTTLRYCASKLPIHWPNTDEPVKSIRMFKAWQEGSESQGGWNSDPWVDQAYKEKQWNDIARTLRQNQVKVLVGTQVTCDAEQDDKDWENVKTMMRIFGAGIVMGLAVGNEMELLYQKDLTDEAGKDIWDDCMDKVWTNQYFLDTFHNRVNDLDQLDNGAFSAVPVTSVFGGSVFAGYPFVENPVIHNGAHPRPNAGLVMTFLNDVTVTYANRWVWSMNIYPYFDPGLHLDADGSGHCTSSLERATCLEPSDNNPQSCLFTGLVATTRARMGVMDTAGGRDGTLWIGETGWSSPKAETLSTDMKWCEAFSQEETFKSYYKTFLGWDMELPPGPVKGPDHVFWFTVRDSANFGLTEGFGLVGGGDDPEAWCDLSQCKLQDHDGPTSTPSPRPSPSPSPGPSPSPSPGPSPSPSPTSTTTVQPTLPPGLVPTCCFSATLPSPTQCDDYPVTRGNRRCNNDWNKICVFDIDCGVVDTMTNAARTEALRTKATLSSPSTSTITSSSTTTRAR